MSHLTLRHGSIGLSQGHNNLRLSGSGHSLSHANLGHSGDLPQLPLNPGHSIDLAQPHLDLGLSGDKAQPHVNLGCGSDRSQFGRASEISLSHFATGQSSDLEPQPLHGSAGPARQLPQPQTSGLGHVSDLSLSQRQASQLRSPGLGRISWQASPASEGLGPASPAWTLGQIISDQIRSDQICKSVPSVPTVRNTASQALLDSSSSSANQQQGFHTDHPSSNGSNGLLATQTAASTTPGSLCSTPPVAAILGLIGAGAGHLATLKGSPAVAQPPSHMQGSQSIGLGQAATAGTSTPASPITCVSVSQPCSLVQPRTSPFAAFAATLEAAMPATTQPITQPPVAPAAPVANATNPSPFESPCSPTVPLTASATPPTPACVAPPPISHCTPPMGIHPPGHGQGGPIWRANGGTGELAEGPVAAL